jgi:hypothetical protein
VGNELDWEPERQKQEVGAVIKDYAEKTVQ